MFTIKLYANDGYRCVIRSADSFTILRCEYGVSEITLHQKNGDNERIDIAQESGNDMHSASPMRYSKAIIENSAGKTTEIVVLGNCPVLAPKAL